MEYLLSFIFGGIGGGFVSWYFYQKKVRWESLKDSGVDALAVVDAVQSHMEWKQDGTTIDCVKQPVDMEKAREALNKLSLTCKNTKVIDCYLDAIGLSSSGKVSGDSIVYLRNALREELGFEQLLDVDKSRAFLAKLKGAE